MTGTPKNFFSLLPNLEDASCKDIEDKSFFFPSDHALQERLPELRAICSTCPAISNCLNFALDQKINDGFWGGKTAKERRKMNRIAPATPLGRTSRVMERGPLMLQMRANGASYEEIGKHFDISQEAAVQTVVRYRKKVRENK